MPGAQNACRYWWWFSSPCVSLQLICDALGNMVAHSPAFGFVDGQHSLSSRLAAVHVVYQSNKTKILWFGQLAYQMPGILESFQHTAPPSDSSEMVS